VDPRYGNRDTRFPVHCGCCGVELRLSPTNGSTSLNMYIQMHIYVSMYNQIALLDDRRSTRRPWHPVLCIHCCRSTVSIRRRGVGASNINAISRLASMDPVIQDVSDVLNDIVLNIWTPLRCIGRRWWLSAMIASDNHVAAQTEPNWVSQVLCAGMAVATAPRLHFDNQSAR
jgi:hypothetical protein